MNEANTRMAVLQNPPADPTKISLTVMALFFSLICCSLGAMKNQLIMLPIMIPGKIHRADRPQLKAMPLKLNNVHAEEALATALMDATQGPNFFPPRKKSAESLVCLLEK